MLRNVRLWSLLFLRSKLRPSLRSSRTLYLRSTRGSSMICPYCLHCTALPCYLLRTAPHSPLHSLAAHCGASTACCPISSSPSFQFVLPIVPICPLGPPYCSRTASAIPDTASAILDTASAIPDTASAIPDGCVSHIVAQSPDYKRPEGPHLYFPSF